MTGSQRRVWPTELDGKARSATAADRREHLGITHAGQTVTIEDTDHTFRIYHDDQLLAEVARTTSKPIARFKARKPEPPRRPSPATRNEHGTSGIKP